MKFIKTTLAGAYLIEPEPFNDERGLFARMYCKNEFRQIGHREEFVQFNHSETKLSGTLRGMHFQYPPYSEIKLLRCIKGRIFDVIIDLRKNSSTFLKWFGAELNEDNLLSMYVPKGFAHGFLTLTDGCRLIYHHTEFYSPGNEGGIRYNDPVVGIKWPAKPLVITEKDRSYTLLDDNFKGIVL